MLNRIQAPAFSFPQKFQLRKPEKVLHGNIPIHLFDYPKNEVCRIDWIFHNQFVQGLNFEINERVIKFLLEGTVHKTSEQIISALDYYGAYIDLKAGTEYHTISIYMHPGFAAQVLDIFVEVLNEASYPQHHIQTLLQIESDKLNVEIQKTSYQARKTFLEALFGGAHPMGYFPKPQDVLQLAEEDFAQFKSLVLDQSKLSVYITGKTHGLLEIVQNAIDKLAWKSSDKPTVPAQFILPSFLSRLQKVHLDQANQCTLRLGHPSLRITHPDYIGLHITTTLFGGYFGSRLMKNIREDKGYTYGIYALLNSYSDQGVWVIASDIGKAYWEDAIVEIKKEMRLLQEEKVSAEEIHLIQNYIKGMLLNQFDSIFANTDKYIAIQQGIVPEFYFESYFEQLNQLDSDRIQHIAQTYFKPQALLEVVAGNFND
jgi:zinc protease